MTLREDFMAASARYMAADRPDLWTVNTAYEAVQNWLGYLENGECDEPGSYVASTGGFELVKIVDDEGYVEFTMNRQLFSLNEETLEDDGWNFDWTKGSQVQYNANMVETDLDF